jgi:hypothetical protein
MGAMISVLEHGRWDGATSGEVEGPRTAPTQRYGHKHRGSVRQLEVNC